MQILIVGGGNMGKTYADSFLSNHAISPENLYILERSANKASYFQSLGFKNVFYQADKYIENLSLIILAVKPQDALGLFEQIRPFIHKNHLLLSVMAGLKMQTLEESLNPIKKIIRAMPNLPAQIGMGMTGFTSTEAVSKEELLWVHNLLNTTGKSLYFENEEQLDAVTAISGSGPAYVYYFMEAMTEAAREMGFTQSQAELLVEQTFLGAVHLVKKSNYSCSEWIEKVASKGGTTEAAIRTFDALNVDKHIRLGLQEALQRAIELGK